MIFFNAIIDFNLFLMAKVPCVYRNNTMKVNSEYYVLIKSIHLWQITNTRCRIKATIVLGLTQVYTLPIGLLWPVRFGIVGSGNCVELRLTYSC